ncbi:MAG: hypothetical protein NTT76_26725, partial [Achromobacter xylosoxidans]|nr:hypothetical protein [Achromobacter xylosoxidans]
AKDAPLDLVVGREGLRIALGNGHVWLILFLYIFAYKKSRSNSPLIGLSSRGASFSRENGPARWHCPRAIPSLHRN